MRERERERERDAKTVPSGANFEKFVKIFFRLLKPSPIVSLTVLIYHLSIEMSSFLIEILNFFERIFFKKF
jgi:hypothetical protein